MDAISKAYAYNFALSTMTRRGSYIGMSFSKPSRAHQNPYRLHDQGYYNQRVSLNIMNKAVQLYNDVVGARDITKSIEQLRGLISAGETISLGQPSLNDLLNDHVDVSITDIIAAAGRGRTFDHLN